MKTISWIFFALIFSSGCSGFYKMHYRKLNKIPVSVGLAENLIKNNKIIVSTHSVIIEKNNCHLYHDSVLPLDQKFSPPVGQVKKNKIIISPQTKNNKVFNSIKKSFSPKSKNLLARKDSKFLIILALLFLGFLLIGYGLFFIYIAFFAPSIIAGILVGAGGLSVLLLGILPFAGVMSMLSGRSKKGEQKPFEEKKN